MAEYDDVKSGLIATVGILSAVFTFALIVALEGMAYRMTDMEVEKKRALSGVASTTKILEQQETQLNKYGWANTESSVAVIPISLAKNLVVKEFAAHSPAPTPEAKAHGEPKSGEVKHAEKTEKPH
jgi:hypothetical protein